ncbi:MAG: glycosyltransferase family 39 protein, partial [Candidatus Omnitrophica bacterium]|nr:glycosyltransferase family 39 protein [Candidatus Omnitrophota bacterium]
RNILCIVVLSFVFFFAGNGIVGLSHPDEVFYAQTAKEMLQRHDWLVPYLFNGPNFEKPIFSYWLFMIAFSTFGVNSFSARLFPSLFALVGVLAVYFLGKKAFQEEKKGLYAALILMSSLLWVGLGRTVFTDMFFTVWIELSLVSFYWGYLQPSRKTIGLVLFWLFAALGVLTKGLLGVLIPLEVAVLFLMLRKELRFLVSPGFGLGFFVFLAVALPWYVYIIEKFGSSFIQEFFYNDHLRRLLEAEHKGNDRWFFYPLSIVGLSAPWGLFAVMGILTAFQKIRQNIQPFYLFLMVWMVVVFCVFQSAHSKLVSYIFPLFPALALLCSEYVFQTVFKRNQRWMFLISALIIPVAGIIAAVLAMTVYAHLIPPQMSLKPALCFFLALTIGICALLVKTDGVLTRLAVVIFQVPVLLTFAFLNHTAFERYVSGKEAAEDLMRIDHSHTPVLCSKLYLRSTRFFTDREVVFLNVNGGGRFFSPHPVKEVRSAKDVLAVLREYPVIHGICSKKDVKALEQIAEKAFTVKVLAVVADENVVELKLSEA